MANPNTPFGLRPVSRLDGGLVGRVKSEYNIANALAANIGFGDPLISTGSSAPATDPRYAGPLVTIFAAGTPPVGVFAGCAYQDNLGNFIWSKNWLTGTVTFGTQGAQVFVFDDPQIIFEAVGDSTGYLASGTGKFAPITGMGAPNAIGISQAIVATASISASLSTTNVFKVNKLSPYANNAYGAFSRVYGFLASHEFRDPQSVQ